MIWTRFSPENQASVGSLLNIFIHWQGEEYLIRSDQILRPQGGDFDQNFFWKVKCPTYARGSPPLGLNIDRCINQTCCSYTRKRAIPPRRKLRVKWAFDVDQTETLKKELFSLSCGRQIDQRDIVPEQEFSSLHVKRSTFFLLFTCG